MKKSIKTLDYYESSEIIMVHTTSFSMYDFFKIKIEQYLKIDVDYPICPDQFGPSGEHAIGRLLENVMNTNYTDELALIVPCLRNESTSLINGGTHLSLFFMFVGVYLGVASEQRSLIKMFELLGVQDMPAKKMININIIESAGKIGNFKISPGGFGPAKNYPYLGLGIELISQKGFEIAHFVKVVNLDMLKENKMHTCYMFGIGIERLLMEYEGKSNIWETTPFASLIRARIPLTDLDKMRKDIYLKNHEKPVKHSMDFSQTLISNREH